MKDLTALDKSTGRLKLSDDPGPGMYSSEKVIEINKIGKYALSKNRSSGCTKIDPPRSASRGTGQ